MMGGKPATPTTRMVRRETLEADKERVDRHGSPSCATLRALPRVSRLPGSRTRAARQRA
jgi:hypothetical protein